MSHVVSSEVVITDLDCLKATLARFPKLHWKEGQTSYEWVGKFYNDYDGKDAAYKRGIDPSQYGHSEHALSLDGCKFEIGVTKRKDGEGYSLVWDFIGDGRKLSQYIGDNAEKLMSAYSEEYCRRYAQETGMLFQSTEMEDGNLRVEMIEV
jgi:hypothetical protein